MDEINLTKPPFRASQFTATKWDTAEDKAKFANHLMKFIQDGYPRAKFYAWFYNRLSNCFGNIAHYNIDGFYSRQFRTDHDRLGFIENCIRWPCHGMPEHTYCDVEHEVGSRLRESGIVPILTARIQAAHEKAERAELKRLQAKFPRVIGVKIGRTTGRLLDGPLTTPAPAARVITRTKDRRDDA